MPSVTDSPDSSQITALSAALDYAGRGWPVHPLTGKRATVKGWPTEASTDPTVIRAWWAERPGANVGIVTGPRSGLAVLDVDPRSGGAESLAALRERVALPPTLTARTGGGGLHLIYRHPGRPLASGAHVLGQGLDVKSDGGYVVGAGSIHPETGETYRWANPGVEVAPWPAALDALIGETRADGAESAGEPSPVLALVLGKLDGVEARSGYYVARCPAHEDGEPSLSIRSHPDGHVSVKCFTRCSTGEIVAALGLTGADLRPADDGGVVSLFDGPPVPLDVADRPPFPVGTLPDPLRSFVSEVAEATQTPPDLAALLSLGALGTLAGGRCWIRVRPGWLEPLNLWTLCALPSASRKSPVVRAVTAPLWKIEKTKREDAARRGPEAEQRKAIATAQADALAKKAGAEDATNEDVERAVDARRVAEGIVVPTAPRLLAGDVTPEAAATLLAEQGGRLGIIDSEGGLIGTLLGRYSAGVANMDVFLKSWSCDTVTIDRRGRSEFIARPSLTLALAVQDDVLREMGSRPESRARGLPARFLFAVPVSTVGRRNITPAPLSDATAEDWADLLATIGEFPTPTDDEQTPLLTLDAEAEALIVAFAAEIEPRLDPERGDLAGVGDWAGKLVGNVARIAGLMHLAEHPAMPEPLAYLDGGGDPGVVSALTVRAAITVGRWAIPHALTAFGVLGRRRDTAPAVAVLRWITGRTDPHAEVTVREVWQAVKGRSAFPDTASAEAALRVLADHDFLALRSEDGERRRGRPRSPRFAVNPETPTGRFVGDPPNNGGANGGAAPTPVDVPLTRENVSSGGIGGLWRREETPEQEQTGDTVTLAELYEITGEAS